MVGLRHGLTTCNQTNLSSLFGESETAPGWVVTQRKVLFAENTEIGGMGSKAVTPQERVNGFLVFRVRMTI